MPTGAVVGDFSALQFAAPPREQRYWLTSFEFRGPRLVPWCSGGAPDDVRKAFDPDGVGFCATRDVAAYLQSWEEPRR